MWFLTGNSKHLNHWTHVLSLSSFLNRFLLLQPLTPLAQTRVTLHMLGFPSLSCTCSQSIPKSSLLWSLTHNNSLLANLLLSIVLPAFPWLTITQVTILSIAVIWRWTQNISMVLFLLTTPRCNTHIYTEIGEKYIFFLSIKWEH